MIICTVVRRFGTELIYIVVEDGHIEVEIEIFWI